MKTIIKSLFNLKEEEEQKLRKLTLRISSSGMNLALTLRKTPLYKELYNLCKIIIRVDEQNNWIAWCLARESKIHKENTYMIFVNEAHRRKGHGKLLANKAVALLSKRNKFKNYCYPWNYVSNEFYEKFLASKLLEGRVFFEVAK